MLEPVTNRPEWIQILLIPIVIALNYGVWLIPSIPVALFEFKQTHSFFLAALSAVLVWILALASYYTYFTILLMFAGLPNLEFMLYSNHLSPTYWSDWQPLFKRLILDQFLEWIPVAVIGGAVVGIISAYWYTRKQKRSSSSSFLKPVAD